MLNKRFKIILIGIFLILLVPFVAMQFSTEVSWSLFDFIVAALLLLSTGLLCEFVLRKIANPKYKIIFLIIVIAVFLLIWIELAVGIFGSPFAGS